MGKKILIVDKDPELFFVLKVLLEDKNYEVIHAINGRNAISLALEHKPDLVLTDIFMPEMDGLEMIKIIRSELLNTTLPIIVLSSCSLEFVKNNPGWNAFIEKPSDIDFLLFSIANLIENKL